MRCEGAAARRTAIPRLMRDRGAAGTLPLGHAGRRETGGIRFPALMPVPLFGRPCGRSLFGAEGVGGLAVHRVIADQQRRLIHAQRHDD
jgi:hypothetical protein